MKQMGMKLKACSLAGSLPLPPYHYRKLSVHLFFHFPPIEEYLVGRITIF
jgi:hypothetical protein